MYHAARVLISATVVALVSSPLSAQTEAGKTPEQREASFNAHKGEFDYLLGDWEFTAESKEYGKFRGYWSAVRLDEGQILDEYRVVGDNGETYYVTTSLRNYNSVLDRWELVGADAGSGTQDFGTGRKVGAEMHIEQRFGVASGKPSLWKIRYYDIGPDRFSWTADRSMDDGKTWATKHQTIEARRIGPARTLGALAPARPPRATASTQATAGRSDPLSGKWGTDGTTLLELQFDGTRAVTGTVIWRAEGQESRAAVAAGTFDPTTGALELRGSAKRPDDGTMAGYVIAGALDKGVLAGTYKFADRTGSFTFNRQ